MMERTGLIYDRILVLIFIVLVRKQIVHNYGHGGFGITMAPGTCYQAVEDFRRYHLSSRSKI